MDRKPSSRKLPFTNLSGLLADWLANPFMCPHCDACFADEFVAACPGCGFVFDPVWVN